MLDGVPYQPKNKPYQTALFVNELVKEDGRQVSFARLIRENPLMKSSQAARLINGLPKCLRDLIGSENGRRYWLKVEELT